jgi:hypothetical protein
VYHGLRNFSQSRVGYPYNNDLLHIHRHGIPVYNKHFELNQIHRHHQLSETQGILKLILKKAQPYNSHSDQSSWHIDVGDDVLGYIGADEEA